MDFFRRTIAAFAIFVASAANLLAGGSGLNVVVVVNTNSTNSLQLGNYYCEKRGVPSENVLRINWTGGNIVWTRAQLDSVLRTPLAAMLTARGISNQIEYLVLSMDIPYRVTNTTVNVNNNFNGTTSALFYGYKDNPADTYTTCTLVGGSTNFYAGSEGIYRQTPPISATSNSWLAIMLTSTNLDAAKAIVDRGVMSDGSFPTQTVYLARSYDLIRSSRYVLFDDAIFDTRLRGNYSARYTNTYTSYGLGTMLGFQNGVQQYNLYDTAFAPGAMADNLTSFSGFLFEISGHTGVMDFMNSGATASYGTVTEPCAYLEKFPSPRNYFYQSRGFSIAECYYQSLTNPYLGVLVGEPLGAPFAMPCDGGWSNLPVNALLTGTTNLSLGFVSQDAGLPIQQVDLFLDGRYARTITNMPPRTNNILYVTLNGFPTNYTIPANASLKSIVSNLVLRLNATAYSNNTKVAAFPRGDRIELRNLNIAKSGSSIPLIVSNNIGAANVLGTFISASGTNFLDTTALGLRNFVVTNSVANGTWLQIVVTKTNGVATTISVTNSAGNTDTSVLMQALMNSINTNSALTNVDSVIAEDLISYIFFGGTGGEFNLRARSPGWAESQIQAVITDSGPLTVIPVGTQRLDENLTHLRQRAHLYVTAGLTNLPISFSFNTTTNADGYHELAAVAYEGSHVRTQKRISQTVRIANTNFSAAFNVLNGGTNTALETMLQFSVVANTNTMNRIELHTTGGLWSTVSNAQTGNFSMAATNLHIGLHPFWALAVRNDGKQYRTDTRWLRIIGSEPLFSLSATGFAPVLKWPATAGRRYEILSVTNLTNAFTLRTAVIPTNSTGLWVETNNSTSGRFYRVRSTP
ncbi:MAG: TIGR03790 family protein [Verrucomicrobia bacterium]|nr:TIGR03790 family protein [Verrucomicrobiota bacterium]